MRTQQDIESMLAGIGATVTRCKKSLAQLHKHLHEGEKITAVMDGIKELAVLTETRVLILRSSLLSGTDVKECKLSSITTVEVDAGAMYSDVVIMVSGTKLLASANKKAEATEFKTKVSEAIAATKQQGTAIDPAAQLEKLATLKQQGLLTEAEYNEQKAKLLQRL